MLHTTLVPIDLESSGEFIFIRYHDFCNMGGERLTLQVEQTIRTLSKEGNSYSVIVKKLKAEGLDVGKATICRVVNGIGKKREAESNGQKFQVDRPRPVRTPATVSKVKRLATTENPPSQRQLSRMCGTSLKTINNIIHKDLELDTRRKGKVHKLTPFHMKNRATNARKLYEEHLAGSRSEYTATLDEAWMYVTYCNGIRKICYIKRGNQVPDNWVHQCSETFPKGFMVVGVMTGRGVLPLIKVPSKVKVNSEFYIECVLKPVIEQLKDLYPGEMDKVFLHHDKASSHTSNKTQQFLQEMKDNPRPKFYQELGHSSEVSRRQPTGFLRVRSSPRDSSIHIACDTPRVDTSCRYKKLLFEEHLQNEYRIAPIAMVETRSGKMHDASEEKIKTEESVKLNPGATIFRIQKT
ncbi:IKK1 [Cordylochernes scorpioides]|uniref:IKK1 n=1 Tax=Cordylochernes scorpioides TaxID=51811 RepID=A0ABY6KLU7_9ARAC|nr:IKK1 [Cordylochernes scorpioides]